MFCFYSGKVSAYYTGSEFTQYYYVCQVSVLSSKFLKEWWLKRISGNTEKHHCLYYFDIYDGPDTFIYKQTYTVQSNQYKYHLQAVNECTCIFAKEFNVFIIQTNTFF